MNLRKVAGYRKAFSILDFFVLFQKHGKFFLSIINPPKTFKSLESDQGIKPLYNLKPLAAVLQFAKVIHFIAAEQVSKGF